MPQRPHLVLLGGFLGAGKTSAMIAFGEWLADQGIRAGCVTNDQGSDLVDTRLLEFCGLVTEEVAGGCFCCRFNQLVDAIHRLRAVLRPDVFIAEAVGSCTDLAATVSRPIRRLLGQECTVGPLSVVVDPIRAGRAFGLAPGEVFSDDVQYIFGKQLQEADLIIVNKRELVAAAALDELVATLEAAFPSATVLAVSVRDRVNLDEWFRRMLYDEPGERPGTEVDYQRYASGEASLGWLNAEVQAGADQPADGDALLATLAATVRERLHDEGAAVAHLKMTLSAEHRLATINLVRGDMAPESGRQLGTAVTGALLTINLRAEAAPEVVERAVRTSLDAIPGWRLEVVHLQSFRPGRPVPTHRDGVTPPST